MTGVIRFCIQIMRKHSVTSTLHIISIFKCRNILNNYTISVYNIALLQICMFFKINFLTIHSTALLFKYFFWSTASLHIRIKHLLQLLHNLQVWNIYIFHQCRQIFISAAAAAAAAYSNLRWYKCQVQKINAINTGTFFTIFTVDVIILRVNVPFFHH